MRLIDADAYQEMAFQRNFDGLMSEEALFNINLLIDKQPTIEVPEQKHGKWIVQYPTVVMKEFAQAKCSVCGSMESRTRFCSNCGAKMDEVWA